MRQTFYYVILLLTCSHSNKVHLRFLPMLPNSVLGFTTLNIAATLQTRDLANTENLLAVSR
jgi:hypothetical protein